VNPQERGEKGDVGYDCEDCDGGGAEGHSIFEGHGDGVEVVVELLRAGVLGMLGQ